MVVVPVCMECLAGTASTGRHDATGINTACEATACGANEKVTVVVCVECPAGKINTGSHDVPGGNTACESTTCGSNEEVVVHAVWNALPERRAPAVTMQLDVTLHARLLRAAPMRRLQFSFL